MIPSINIVKEKTQSTGGNLVKRQRRIEVLEQQLKQTRKEAQSLQFKTSIFSAVVQMIMIYFVNSMYSGIPVAKLPFTPIGLFQGITHRGLEGTDYTECSAMFLFIIGTLVSKSLLEKVLGFAIPKSGNTVPEWVTNPEALLDGLQKQR
ncbi:hypothetical protein H4219_000072 [Mycoemilia scoparia]|uniref:Calcium load-activated calcium channel n=1 Tax=Mycoemilia scoparia TaxID=417184 RepID=A0A9W8DXB8_9FUNG|nr:hypothetical protein H4219_000072 [Mycoemilia scoparia]